MTFLAPGYFIAACIASVAVIALHFLVTREPRTSVFPTVRFVPQAQVRSLALAFRLTDIPLLLLRIAIVLLIGAALAQPRVAPLRRDVARVVALDVSRAVERNDEWRSLVRKRAAGADAIVAFDSRVLELSPGELDALLAQPSARADASAERGSLSAGLIASLRAASRLRDTAEEIELLLISPLVVEERDAATLSIRSLWPGGITIVRTPAPQAAVGATHEAAATGNGGGAAPADRSSQSAAPAAEPAVEWADSPSAASPFWAERPRSQIVGGIRAGDATLIYPFERRWRLKEPLAAGSRVIARWIDGEPAAIEQVAGAPGGCLRSIGFALPKAGDATLRSDFVRFMSSLKAPCGDLPRLAPLPAEFASALAGSGSFAASSAVAPPEIRTTPLVPWLLAAGLLLLALECPMRRFSSRRRDAGTPVDKRNGDSAQLRAAA